jgi:hypothetical protein
MRDAVDYASRLLEVDPVSERASRSLMLGYAGMGEVHPALREYERCREVLAEELGVDPSPQTRAVHLQVLRPAPPARPTSVLVGRRSEVAWLDAVLVEASTGREQGRPCVVVLGGRTGSGRKRLARSVLKRAGLPLDEVSSGQALLDAARSTEHALLWQPDLTTDLGTLERLLTEPAAVVGSGLVVVRAPARGEDPAWDRLVVGEDVRSLELEPLLHDDVERLASHLLGGPVTLGLVEALYAETDGLPGGIMTTARRWSTAGRLVATGAGLALAPADDGDDQSGRRALTRALPRLDGDALEALLLAAVLDQPVTPSLLGSLLSEDAGPGRIRATAALEQLVDLALLRTSPAGSVWRHPRLRDAVHGWMRPAVRRRLHRRVAEQAPIPSAGRISHWLEAGERELACVAALEAAGECSARGDHAGARTHLLEVCSLGDLPEAATSDRVDLFERLGDACSLLRRPEEARTAYEQALEVARANLLDDSPRLSRKVEAASDPRALELAPAHRTSGVSPALAGLSAVTRSVPDATLEAALLDAVAQADRTHDQQGRFQARLQLAGDVCLPRREFRATHEWIEAALVLNPKPAERLRAALVRHLPSVLMGRARDVREPLATAAKLAEDAGEDATWWRLLGMRVVVAHDLGDPKFETLWPVLRDRVQTGAVDELVPELATVGLRVLVEREELDLALAMAQHLSFAGGHSSLVMEHLAGIAEADLAEATGEHRHAADLLRHVIDGGMATGCTLMVPEAAARLVALEAASDAAAARAAFEVYDEVVGAAFGGPREEFWRRMARAAIRAAQGDHVGAAGACAQASALAHKHGLQVLAARARRARAEHVRSGLPRSLSVVSERRGTAG